MKMLAYKIVILFIFSSYFIAAQNYEGPFPKITSGYGSYGNHPVSEIQFQNTWAFNEYGAHPGDSLTLRYASDIGGPMPTVLFASGWNQHDPEIFDNLLYFIASKGYAVLFTPYKTYGSGWGQPMYHGMKQGLEEYSGKTPGNPNIIDTTKIGFFGHSLGAGYIYWLAKKFYVDHGYGANAKFMFSVAGWIGFDITRQELETFPSDCNLLVQIWEEDDHNPNNNPPGITSPRIQYDLFHNINIPIANKNYVKVLGGPDQSGYHYSTGHKLVTTSSIAGGVYDALDFWAIFRPLDAMMDFTFNGTLAAKDIAFGFDPDMGPFPDLDTDYNTFVFEYDESTYDYQCKVDSNPHKDFCPTSPLSIEVLEPLTASIYKNNIYLNWSTSSEVFNKGFEIQHSFDGLYWQKIEWVDGGGNTSKDIPYSTIHAQPRTGLNYYRYKQIDQNNSFTFSNIVKIYFAIDYNSIQLYPNPAKEKLNISFQDEIYPTRIVIKSILGQSMIIINQGESSIDISKLQSGIYYISIYTNQGLFEKKFMVK